MQYTRNIVLHLGLQFGNLKVLFFPISLIHIIDKLLNDSVAEVDESTAKAFAEATKAESFGDCFLCGTPLVEKTNDGLEKISIESYFSKNAEKREKDLINLLKSIEKIDNDKLN